MYEIFLILLKDRRGRPRGIEKAWNDTIFYSEEEAQRVLDSFDDFVKQSYQVVRAEVSYDMGVLKDEA